MTLSKTFVIFIACVAVLMFTVDGAPQRKKPASQTKRNTKQAPQKDAIPFDQQVVEALKKAQSWRYFQAPEFSLKAQLPREPVRQTDSFYDDSIGKVEIVMYVGVGDSWPGTKNTARSKRRCRTRPTRFSKARSRAAYSAANFWGFP